MNGKQLGLSVLLVAFAAFEAYAVWQHGVVGVFEALLANTATMVAFTDLVIVLSLAIVWMAFDARERGLSVAPYVVLTVTLGSVGLLLYLIRRETARSARLVQAAGQAA